MFCSNCGESMKPTEAFCGVCGTKNTGPPPSDHDQQPAKSIDRSGNYSTPPNQGYNAQPPESTGRSQGYQQPTGGYAPNAQYNIYPPKRDFFLWLILGFCTCGIGSIVYIYHNFNDVRKLEIAKQYQTNRMMRQFSTDPALAIIVYFVCSPISYIMKYSNLNAYIDHYGDRFYDPLPASGGKLVGTWVLVFFLFIIGLVILPLLLVAFGMIFYIIYLDKQWQDSLNFQIDKIMMQINP